MKHIFIVGSNGIPASYGGFETFVDQLTAHQENENIQYHVSCLAVNRKEFEYNGAHCFNIKVPKLGPAKAIYYDIASIRYCCKYIRNHQLQNTVVYVLGCGIGPFIKHCKKQLHRVGAKYFVNPDGLEWKRGKWKSWVKKYLKYSEKQMVINSDLVICDSISIEKYIQSEYKDYALNTTFIAYGADTSKSNFTRESSEVRNWFSQRKISEGNYYLAVGRFVPENNFETMLNEFHKSSTKKDFVLITNVEQNGFFEQLKEKTNFMDDKRIKFVGTVYDQELLKYIRENAFGYIHGHEVGGTNPSLLEALASTKLNLLLDVGFNREVGKDGAMYWDKQDQTLSTLLQKCDSLSEEDISNYGERAKSRIANYYNWNNISQIYERIFERNLK